jgi:DNA replication protein DnaC
MGSRYSDCRVNNFDVLDDNLEASGLKQLAKEKVTEYLTDVKENIEAGKNVLFYGTKGTGKDHLMAAMMVHAVNTQFRVEWRDAAAIFSEARATWGTKNSDIETVIKPLVAADVLAISDPVQRGRELDRHEVTWLSQIVDRRYRNKKPIWCTMNVTDGDDAQKQLTPAIWDRLRDGAVAIECKWQSFRELG